MNLFLDTHVLLWWLDDSPNLFDAERYAIADDRMIIAQARLEKLCIITRDNMFSKYDVSVFT